MEAVALYDLENDVSESDNVLEKHPDITERLLQHIAAFRKDLEQNSRPAAFINNPVTLRK